MKIKNYLPIMLFIIGLILVSCRSESYFIGEPNEEEARKISAIGSQFTKQLLDTLKTTLKTTFEEKGAVEAIKICRIEALPMAIVIAKSSEFDVEIKRTSKKVRNLGNLPDKPEQMALKKYEEYIKQNQSIPEFYIHKVTEDETVYYNYYQPLKAAKLCISYRY